MTVGIAALAERRQAIVLIADKQFTDEASGLRVSGHDLKAFQLVNGWIVLYAGDPTFATLVVQRAENQLRSGVLRLTDAVGAMNWMRDAYMAVYEDEVDRVVFRPSLLERDRFVQRTYDEATIRGAEAQIERFQISGTCELLLCGFDADDEGQIIKVTMDACEISDSYATIGSGGAFADAHLAWRRTESSDPLPRVVYEAYEAKLHAELNAYVGTRDDALVMVSNERGEVRLLSDDTKELIRVTVMSQDFTPFRSAAARREEAVPQPPRDWERVLVEDKLGPISHALRNRRRV